MRLAIATSPATRSGAVTLAADVSLARAAILYADEVELISPAAELLSSAAALSSGTEQDLLAVFTSLDDETLARLGLQTSTQNWREILSVMTALDDEGWAAMNALTGAEIPQDALHAMGAWRATLSKAMQDLGVAVEGMLEASGAVELIPAMEAGLLRISPTVPTADGSSDMVEQFVSRLTQLLRNPSVHLLLDEATASLVRAMVNEGIVEPSRLTLMNAGQASVGSGLISRLPAFDRAPIDELLDLRRDLQGALSRYRRSVSMMAGKLRTEPFEEALGADIDHLYLSEVDPALADLREGLAEHGLVREIARDLGSDVGPVVLGAAGSAIALGVTSVAELTGWTAAAAAAAVGGGGLKAVQSTISGILESRSQQSDLRRRDLFYLYEIDRRGASG